MNKLLVAYDYTSSSDVAIKLAISIAEKFQSHIWLLHVVEPEPDFIGYTPGPQNVREQVAIEYHNEHKKLQSLAGELKNRYSNITPISAQGAVADTILSQADKKNVDLILIGSTGKSKLKSILLGSVSEYVVKNSNKSVLVCR